MDSINQIAIDYLKKNRLIELKSYLSYYKSEEYSYKQIVDHIKNDIDNIFNLTCMGVQDEDIIPFLIVILDEINTRKLAEEFVEMLYHYTL